MKPVITPGKFFALTFAIVALFSGAESRAQAVVDEDAYISFSSINGNFGTSPALTVSPTNISYVKFKLTPVLPDGTSGATVKKAVLKLFLSKVGTPGKIDIYTVAAPWNESAVTYGNRPALGYFVGTTQQIEKTAEGRFVIIDLTNLVQNWLGDDGQGGNGIANFGIALLPHPVDNTTPKEAIVTFDSKENSQTSHEARLDLQLDGSVGDLQTVAHDASLIGNGTVNASLGVAANGINATHLADGSVGSTELSDGSVTSAKMLAPLALTSAGPGFTLSAANTGSGPAITAAGSINTSTQYNIGGDRILSKPGNNNLFAGANAGTANIAGGFNSFFGTNSGAANISGGGNAFFGFNAGAKNLESNNSFFGTDAGRENTSGTFNAFFGRSAGRENMAGSSNSFFGTDAGLVNAANNNSFFGRDAGKSNTSGTVNAFFGRSAGLSNTTGSSNTFVGFQAGRDNTTGFNNSYFGDAAGLENLIGSENSAFGFLAGRFNTANNNSFFGRGAGVLTTTGSGNAFFGWNAGFNNASGGNNTILGSAASFGSNDLNFATAIGSGAVVSSNNSVVLGRAVDSVGIGNSAPKTKLHVTGGKIYVEANGQGVVLKSPNGSCYELTISDAGVLVSSAVVCP